MLLLGSLLWGSGDLHRAGDLHGDGSEAAAWSARATTLSHGGRTPHACAAERVLQRPCPACLHRLRTSGARLLPAGRPIALRCTGIARAAAALLTCRRPIEPRPARGPPAR